MILPALTCIAATTVTCTGNCPDCGVAHELRAGEAVEPARMLLAELEERGRIDLDATDPDPVFSLDHLLGEARGQMFGVLICEDGAGNRHELKAFSGQYNGRWRADGWVPPVVDPDGFHRVNAPGERKVKELGRELASLAPADPRHAKVERERADLSRDLMKRLHALYVLKNFRGDERPMAKVFGPGNMPTGTGDCCAPKLLVHAARLGLKPLGLVEFYVGRENRSKTRRHGRFYPSCESKCRPLMGFLLCGLE